MSLTPSSHQPSDERAWPRLCFLLSLALLTVACLGPGMEAGVSERRVASEAPRQGWSAGDRFGQKAPGRAMSPKARPEPQIEFRFDMPAGWKELPANSMRLVNLQPAGDPEASCSVSVFGGDGGGLAANLNRWRAQLGLDPQTAEDFAALPKVRLLGAPAALIELTGTYTGMGGENRENWGLIGAVLSTPRGTAFVKMTSSAERLAEEREAFVSFVESLVLAGDPPKPAGEAAAKGGAEHEGGEVYKANGFRYSLPSGWADAGPRTMRALNFRAGDETECYLTVLGGAGGGLAANLNRWQGQMGKPPLSESEIEALPRVQFLGSPAHMLDVSGSFSGMDGKSAADRTMLGIVLVRSSDALFLKMVGPQAEVSGQREAFVALAESLEELS